MYPAGITGGSSCLVEVLGVLGAVFDLGIMFTLPSSVCFVIYSEARLKHGKKYQFTGRLKILS